MNRTLIVDGYNVIHAWPQLRGILTAEGLESSRVRLIRLLAEYAAVSQVAVTVVFDGPRAPAGKWRADSIDGVGVVFSGPAGASADHVIERLAYEASQAGGAAEVMVATSDRLQRDMVGAMGVASIDSRALEVEVGATQEETAAQVRRRGDAGHPGGGRLEDRLDSGTRAQLEALRRGQSERRPERPAKEEDPG